MRVRTLACLIAATPLLSLSLAACHPVPAKQLFQRIKTGRQHGDAIRELLKEGRQPLAWSLMVLV